MLKVIKVKEIKRGHALIIKKDGKFLKKKSESLLTEHPARLKEFILAEETTRIFIKKDLSLEKNFPKVLDAINNDVKNTVFSYIPNTAEVIFWFVERM